MNKARRHELKMLHFRRRLINYRIKPNQPIVRYHQEGGSFGLSVSPKNNFHAFRTTGKPCSCSACQQPENNYHRAKEKASFLKELNKYDSQT